MSKANSTQYFYSLTGLRAIAAWMIFVFHFVPFKNPNYNSNIKLFFSNFHIGVDLFFVLSGFLITYRYFNKKNINYRNYMVNRFARIYPVFFLFTIGYILYNYCINNFDFTYENFLIVITNLTLTKTFFQDIKLSLISQSWTLTLEEIFYISAPLLIFILKNKKWIFLCLPFLIILTFELLSKNNLPNQYFLGLFKWNFSYYCIEFFLGMYLARIINYKTNFNYYTYLGIFFLLVYLTFIDYMHLFNSYILNKTFQVTILSLFCILPIIYGLVNENTFISKILSTKIFQIFGKSSYILYLIHKGFITILIYKYITTNWILIFILINLISVLFYYYYEKPLNSYIRQKLRK